MTLKRAAFHQALNVTEHCAQ